MHGNDGGLQKLIHGKLGALQKLIHANDGGLQKLTHGKLGGLQKLIHGKLGGLQKLIHGKLGGLQKLIQLKLGILQKLIHGKLGILQKLIHGNLILQKLTQTLGTITLISDGRKSFGIIEGIIKLIIMLIGGIGGGGSILISLILIKLGILLSTFIILGIASVGTIKIIEGIEIGPNSIKDGIGSIGPKLIKLGIGGSTVITDGIFIFGIPMSKTGNIIGGILITGCGIDGILISSGGSAGHSGI